MPPSWLERSIRVTLEPFLAAAMAAQIPALPPPMMAVSVVMVACMCALLGYVFFTTKYTEYTEGVVIMRFVFWR